MASFPYRRGHGRRVCLQAFGLLMLMGMTACGAADRSAEANPASALPESDSPSMSQPPTTPPVVRPRPTVAPTLPKPMKPTSAPAIPAATASRADGWQIYRSTQVGWSIAYPPDWTVGEQGGDDGPSMISLRPASGAGITVVVQAGAPPAIQPSEKSKIVCARVAVGRLTGTRCVDSSKGTIATTVAGKGRYYVIATTGKGVDVQLYQRILDSFVSAG
ncbi:MAG: hypothetical protein ABIV47_11675 [Roseiflexaceae bacterium]